MRSGPGVHRNSIRKARVAVPPGVGDTYWALSKLHDFKIQNKIEHLTLCVQKSPLARALDWHEMVGFVDATEEFRFRPDAMALEIGFSNRVPGVDCVFWPNAVIDRGKHLSEWLPQYRLDLDFPIKLPGSQQLYDVCGHAVEKPIIYASSPGPGRAWLPSITPLYWAALISAVGHHFGQKPVLIGSMWDIPVRNAIREVADTSGFDVDYYDLVGQTTLPEILALIERAPAMVGLICGMTIMGNHFNTPTISLAPAKFLPGFLTSWIKPGTVYAHIQHPADPAGTMPAPDEIARMMLDLVEAKRQSQ